MIDEAASRLRLQQESKPEVLQDLDHSILTMHIELESLKKETSKVARERREKLESEIKSLEKESDRLTRVWREEKEQLQRIKALKARLEAARDELEMAQRRGDLARASELRYGVIPQIEQQLPKEAEEGTEGEDTHLVRQYVTSNDIAS